MSKPLSGSGVHSVPLQHSKWGSFSLRVRAATILTFFILVTALIVGTTFRSAIRIMLNQQIDIELEEDADEFVELLATRDLQIDGEQTRLWNRHASLHKLHHWFMRIFDDRGKITWNSISVPTTDIPDLDPTKDGPQSSGIYRVLQRNLHYAPGDERAASKGNKGWVQIGCSTEAMDQSLRQLDVLLGTIFVILTLCGPLISIFLTSRLLNPLIELTRKTDELQIERSSQLLPLGGSGDELDRLAMTINSLIVRVRSQLKQHEDWIANSAHQLRSPLAAIMSNVEVVLSRLPGGTSSTMLESVIAECEYLNKLVNQLLLLSEANAFGIHQNSEDLRLDLLVSKSCDFFEVLASSNDIELTCEPLPAVTVDANPEHVRIVIHNLLENAIKYTLAGGTIAVRMTADLIARHVTLAIRDTGIGISETDLDKVARRFFRSDSGRDPSTTPRGSGLGLNIVKTIVEALDGQMRIESQLGKGTTIYVTLPLSNSPIH